MHIKNICCSLVFLTILNDTPTKVITLKIEENSKDFVISIGKIF
jgi:hypothetical protein